MPRQNDGQEDNDDNQLGNVCDGDDDGECFIKAGSFDPALFL